MGSLVDLTNKKINALLVIEKSPKKSTCAYWVCKCDCGKIKTISSQALKNGQKSCGCLNYEGAVARGRYVGSLPKTHCKMLSAKFRKEYLTWQNIKARCKQKKLRCYPSYGGRGIKVCSTWINDFEKFLKDMGRAPTPKHTIDRINNDGNYEPSNCRWATRDEQAFNTSKNVFFEHNGKRMSITQWSVYLGGAPQLVRTRLTKGWDLERALSTPVLKV